MTIIEQIETTAVGGAKVIPVVGVGITIGIMLSIIPVFLMSFGLKITDKIFSKVVE